jgi:hypothetical protein
MASYLNISRKQQQEDTFRKHLHKAGLKQQHEERVRKNHQKAALKQTENEEQTQTKNEEQPQTEDTVRKQQVVIVRKYRKDIAYKQYNNAVRKREISSKLLVVINQESTINFDLNNLKLLNYYNNKSSSNSLILTGTYENKPIYCKLFYDSEENLLVEKKIYSYIAEKSKDRPDIVNHFVISPAVFSTLDYNIFLTTNAITSVYVSTFYKNKIALNYKEASNERINSVDQPKINGIITYDYNGSTLSTLLETFTNEDSYIYVIFELLYSIYIMNTYLGIMHHDLHFDNIIVKEIDNPTNYTYIINNKKYVFKKKFEVRIYDFDFSYVNNNIIEIKNNNLDKTDIYNNKSKCYEYGSCNKKSNKDIFVLLASLIYMSTNETDIYHKLYNIISKNNNILYSTIINNKKSSENIYWSSFCNINEDECKFIKDSCNNTYIHDIDVENVMERYLDFFKQYVGDSGLIKDSLLFTEQNPLDTPIKRSNSVSRSPKLTDHIDNDRASLSFHQSKNSDIRTYKKYLKYKQKYLALKNIVSYN